MTSGLTVLAFPFPCRRQPLDFAGTATAARVGHPNLIPHPCIPPAGRPTRSRSNTRFPAALLLAVEAICTFGPHTHIHSFSTNFISSFQHLFPATKRFVSTPPSDCAQRSVTASVLCVECIVERLSVAVTRFFFLPPPSPQPDHPSRSGNQHRDPWAAIVATNPRSNRSAAGNRRPTTYDTRPTML
jgi:hypothetical protein